MVPSKSHQTWQQATGWAGSDWQQATCGVELVLASCDSSDELQQSMAASQLVYLSTARAYNVRGEPKRKALNLGLTLQRIGNYMVYYVFFFVLNLIPTYLTSEIFQDDTTEPFENSVDEEENKGENSEEGSHEIYRHG